MRPSHSDSVIDELQRELRELVLHECPSGGTVCLYLEHFSKNAFFPIIWHPQLPDSCKAPYYLCPFVFDGEENCHVNVNTTDFERLAKRFRFEIASGVFSECIYQRVEVIVDQHGESRDRLLLVHSSPSNNLSHISWDQRHTRLLHAIRRTWIRLHTESLRLDRKDGSVDKLCDQVLEMLGDVRETPPYFPVLRFQISFWAPELEGGILSRFGFNFLSLNCLIRSVDPQVDAPWVLDVFTIRTKLENGQWREDVTQHTRYDRNTITAELQFIADKTIDTVRVIGQCKTNEGNFVIVARHNKLRNPDETLASSYVCCDERLEPCIFASPRDAFLAMLQHQVEESDALITFWAVTEERNGKPSTALQLGVREGKALNAIGCGFDGTVGNEEIQSENEKVRLRAVLPPGVTKATFLSELSPVVNLAGKENAEVTRAYSEHRLLDALQKVRERVCSGLDWHPDQESWQESMDDKKGLFPINAMNLHKPCEWSDAQFAAVESAIRSCVEGLIAETTGRQASQDRRTLDRESCWEVTALNSLRDCAITGSLLARIVAPALPSAGWAADADLRRNHILMFNDMGKVVSVIKAFQRLRVSGCKCISAGVSLNVEPLETTGGDIADKVILIRMALKEDKTKDFNRVITSVLKAISLEADPKISASQPHQLTSACQQLRIAGAQLKVGYNPSDECWLIDVAFSCADVGSDHLSKFSAQ